jgi:hypothetical protein
MLPKHSSYFDYLGNVKEDSYYKVYLTPEGHADQHKILYQVFGSKFDKIASDGLSGQKNIKLKVFSEAGKIGGKVKPSSESKNKMSQSKIGKKLTDDHKKKISDGNIGKIKSFSDDHKQKISESLLGNSRRKDSPKTWKPDEEYKQKMSEIKKGKKPHSFTEETRQKMSESAKNRKKKKT